MALGRRIKYLLFSSEAAPDNAYNTVSGSAAAEESQ